MFAWVDWISPRNVTFIFCACLYFRLTLILANSIFFCRWTIGSECAAGGAEVCGARLKRHVQV